MSAIVAKNLIHTYKAHFWSRAKHALCGLDLAVEEGEIFGYLGSNGAGKTTTIKILVGLQRATSGQATLFGQPVSDVNARRQVGFQPENPYFYEYLTAVESMLFYAGLCDVPRKEARKRTDELLEFVGLTDVRQVRVKEYSKGMRQRLGLAQSIIHKPKLIILDEPMSGLDPVGRRQVREMILQLHADGLTVFFSSHVLGDVEMICDRVGLLMDGKMHACGTVDELLQAKITHIEVGAENLSAAVTETIRTSATQVLSRDEVTVFTFPDWSGADAAVQMIEADAAAHLSLVQPVRETLEAFFMRTTTAPSSATKGGGNE